MGDGVSDMRIHNRLIFIKKINEPQGTGPTKIKKILYPHVKNSMTQLTLTDALYLLDTFSLLFRLTSAEKYFSCKDMQCFEFICERILATEALFLSNYLNVFFLFLKVGMYLIKRYTLGNSKSKIE